MLVRELMTKDVVLVAFDTPLDEAARGMREQDVGALPVTNGERLIGMLTDRDITIRAAADGRHPSQVRVQEIMTPEVIYCFEDQEVEAAAAVMRDRRIRRLPVVSRAKCLTGMLVLGDIARGSGSTDLAGETIRAVSRPDGPGERPTPRPVRSRQRTKGATS